MLDQLTDWVVRVVEELGYLGVAFLVALENLFPPIPSEVVLPFAGFVARDGDAALVGMIAAATVGSMVGAWILYGFAAAVGPLRIHTWVVRYGGWFRVSAHDLRNAEDWFDRRAVFAVSIGRCVPLVRSIVSIPAGLRRMPIVPFTLYTLIGSTVWNTALIGAGYVLRDNWDRVEPVLSVVQYAVVAVILMLVARFVWKRWVATAPREA